MGRARLPQTVPNRSRSPTTATAWTLPTCCRCCCVGEPVCPCTAVRSSTCGSVARYSVVMRGSVDHDRLGTVSARTVNGAASSAAPSRSRSSRHCAVRSFYRGRRTAGTFLVLPCRRYRAPERRWDTSSFGNNEMEGSPKGGLSVDHEQCAACDFDGSQYESAQLLDAIRDLGPQWIRLLLDAGDELRQRPAPETWSALEYAAHSRDVTALHVFGVEQALTVDEPTFPEIAGTELVQSASARYAAQDPDAVGGELESQAGKLADLAQESAPSSWSRGITIGDSRSDVRGLLEHALHDSHHHLVDVKDGLAVLRARSH